VVLPVRGIADGKSRLAAVLDASARAAFNEWLLKRTLDALQAWRGGLDACVVVSACERAGAIARRYGAHVIDQSAGLNAAATLGARHAAERGASSVLVLPCDLPELDARALDALVDAAHGGDVTIAPDSSGTGTNALMMPARAAFEFRFGADSFARHCDVAAACGLSVVVHRSRALAFDVDTPADYARWKATAAKPVL
jgi:2-phospho-L-lactate guanylyltransferase